MLFIDPSSVSSNIGCSGSFGFRGCLTVINSITPTNKPGIPDT